MRRSTKTRRRSKIITVLRYLAWRNQSAGANERTAEVGLHGIHWEWKHRREGDDITATATDAVPHGSWQNGTSSAQHRWAGPDLFASGNYLFCKAEGSRAAEHPNGGFCAGGTARPAYIEAAVPWRKVAKCPCLCHKMCRVFKWKSHWLSSKKYEHMCRHQTAADTPEQPRWQRPSWRNTSRCRPDRIDSISIVHRFDSSCGG